jgi:hypothetical protein
MRKLALSVIVAFTFYVTAAVAQSGNSGSMGGSTGAQGTQQSSPGATSPNGQNGQVQPGTPAGTEAPGVGPNTGPSNSAPSDQMGTSNKGEKKLKGCVQSQSGQYVLESKHGKTVMLTGQDLSAHVGHEVKVKGTWESGGSSAMSSTSTAGASNTGEKTFNVTNVEMVSETCKDNGNSSNNNSGSSTGAGSTGSTTGSGTTGTGTGTGNTGSGSSTGTGTGSGTGSSTTPPQQ